MSQVLLIIFFFFTNEAVRLMLYNLLSHRTIGVATAARYRDYKVLAVSYLINGDERSTNPRSLAPSKKSDMHVDGSSHVLEQMANV